MLIQYGQLERLEDFVHIDVTIENISPNGVQNIFDIHALRLVLERIRSEGGIDIEIATIVAQPDAVSAWMIERTGPQKAISSGTPCALFAQIRGERISQLRVIRGSSLDQI